MEIGNVETKVCKSCGESKAVTEYYTHSTSKDRLHTQCKKCCNVYSKKWSKNERNRWWKNRWLKNVLVRSLIL